MNRRHSALSGRFLPKPSIALGLAEALDRVAAVAITQAYLNGELWRRSTPDGGDWRAVPFWSRQDPL